MLQNLRFGYALPALILYRIAMYLVWLLKLGFAGWRADQQGAFLTGGIIAFVIDIALQLPIWALARAVATARSPTPA